MWPFRKRTPEELTKLDTTTRQALLGERLLVCTSIIVGAAFVSQILGPDKAKAWAIKMLEMWLWFLAGVLGIGAGKYGLQRFSSKEYVGAKPPELPPTTGTFPVQVSTESGDVNVIPPKPTPRVVPVPAERADPEAEKLRAARTREEHDADV